MLRERGEEGGGLCTFLLPQSLNILGKGEGGE